MHSVNQRCDDNRWQSHWSRFDHRKKHETLEEPDDAD